MKLFIIGCIFITTSSIYGMTISDKRCHKIASLGLTLVKDEPVPNDTLRDEFLSGIANLKTNNPQDARNYFNDLMQDANITTIPHGYYYFLVTGLMVSLIDGYNSNEATMQTGLYGLQHTNYLAHHAKTTQYDKYGLIQETCHYNLLKIIREHKLPLIDWYVEPGAPQFLQRQIDPMDGATHKKNCAILVKIAQSFPSSKTFADNNLHPQKIAMGIAYLAQYNLADAIKNFTEVATSRSTDKYLALPMQATLMLGLIKACSHDAQQHEIGLSWLQQTYKNARLLFAAQKAPHEHEQRGDPNSDFYPIIWQTAAQQLIAFGQTTYSKVDQLPGV